MSGRLFKIRSVHTYVIPRTVYFGWICILWLGALNVKSNFDYVDLSASSFYKFELKFTIKVPAEQIKNVICAFWVIYSSNFVWTNPWTFFAPKKISKDILCYFLSNCVGLIHELSISLKCSFMLQKQRDFL